MDNQKIEIAKVSAQLFTAMANKSLLSQLALELQTPEMTYSETRPLELFDAIFAHVESKVMGN